MLELATTIIEVILPGISAFLLLLILITLIDISTLKKEKQKVKQKYLSDLRTTNKGVPK